MPVQVHQRLPMPQLLPPSVTKPQRNEPLDPARAAVEEVVDEVVVGEAEALLLD